MVVEAGDRLLGLGIDSETVLRLVRIGGALGELEVDAVVLDVKSGTAPGSALERLQRRRTAVTRLLASVRQGHVSHALRRVGGIGAQLHDYARELLYVPSPLFAARYGLPYLLAEARADAEQLASPSACHLHGRLLMILGRHAEASRWFETGLAAERTGILLAYLAVARLFLGELGSAQAAVEEARLLAPRSLLVACYAAVVRAFQAGSAEDLTTATSAVHDALELLRESATLPPPDEASEHVEALLARGRVCLLMPAPFGLRERGAADLRQVLAIVEATNLEPPGVADIYRIHAHYFLGTALADAAATDDSGATRQAAVHALREVLRLDPGCAFAERAYDRLGALDAPVS